jgi:hypothetical protein
LFPGFKGIVRHSARVDYYHRHALLFERGGLLTQEPKGTPGGALFGIDQHRQQRSVRRGISRHQTERCEVG